MLSPTALELALLSAGVLGFRHGFDYDHIAAISDITSVEPSRKRAMRMGLLYVIGHASTVAVLGGARRWIHAGAPGTVCVRHIAAPKWSIRAQIAGFDSDRRFSVAFLENSK